MALGLSQQQVSDQANLSKTAYNMYEDGRSSANLLRVETFARILSCQAEWLAFGIGSAST